VDKYEIAEDLINKILGYLGTRPYIEVAGLITEIQGGVKKVEDERTVAKD
jgi:hypothetical protein